jgi:hypothetical protein
MQPTTLRFFIFFLSASKCDKKNTLRYAIIIENSPNMLLKLCVVTCELFLLAEGRDVNRQNNNGFTTGWMQRQG